MKNNKGITMISLVITIIVLIIVTSVTIYNGTAQLGIKRVNNLYADIDSISTKVAEYYLKNEKLPVFENEYIDSIDSQTKLEKIFKENGATTNITNVNDDGAYYVIDLTKLDNLTLNYGDDYKEWSNTSTSDDLQNIYIINSVTHQIYFPHGVRSGKDYYFAKFPDDKEVPKIELEDIDDEWSITINSISSNEIDENNITILAEVTLNGILENYNLNSLEYAWTETNDESDLENISFTKFNVNEEDKTATITSKALSNTAEYYYLWVKVVDINGKVKYKDITKSASPLTGNLPSNYQKVEYIESTGTQYINSDYIPTSNTNMELEFEYLGTDSTGSWIPICGERSSTKSTYFNFFISSSGSIISPNYGEYDPGTSSEIRDLQLNTKYNLKNVGGDFFVNGQLKSSTTQVLTTGTTPIYIFAIGNKTSVDNRKIHLKLYDFKLYEGNQIVRKFIPCYKKAENPEENKPGLYDLVEGKFYTNQLTTGNDFTIGESVY